MNHKRIITVDETADKVIIVGIEDDGSAYISSADILDLPKYTAPDIDAVRKEAYDKGYDTAKHECEDCTKPVDNGKAYQMGLNDAWEAARKIGSNSMCSLKEMGFDFSQCAVPDYNPSWFVVKNYSASEAIEKIRQYEQEKEEQDGLRQNIQTIVDQCGYSLDEIATVLQKMKES